MFFITQSFFDIKVVDIELKDIKTGETLLKIANSSKRKLSTKLYGMLWGKVQMDEINIQSEKGQSYPINL